MPNAIAKGAMVDAHKSAFRVVALGGRQRPSGAEHRINDASAIILPYGATSAIETRIASSTRLAGRAGMSTSETDARRLRESETITPAAPAQPAMHIVHPSKAWRSTLRVKEKSIEAPEKCEGDRAELTRARDDA
jgi:hypothetical protein